MTDAAFQIVTDYTPVGIGHLVVDRYRDGEIVAQTIVAPGITHPLRPGAAYALRVLAERAGEVVPHDTLMLVPGGSRDTLRRDLGDLRAHVEDVGAEVEVVRGVGYRLRDAGARAPRLIAIGDVMLDLDARVLACGGRRVRLGDLVARILVRLADDGATDVAALYRAVWGGQPYEVEAVVAMRVSALRAALREVGSRVTVSTWTLHELGQSRCAYFLRLPKSESPQRPHVRRVAAVVPDVKPAQMTMFTELNLAAGRKYNARVVRYRRPMAVPENMIPLFQ